MWLQSYSTHNYPASRTVPGSPIRRQSCLFVAIKSNNRRKELMKCVLSQLTTAARHLFSCQSLQYASAKSTRNGKPTLYSSISDCVLYGKCNGEEELRSVHQPESAGSNYFPSELRSSKCNILGRHHSSFPFAGVGTKNARSSVFDIVATGTKYLPPRSVLSPI